MYMYVLSDTFKYYVVTCRIFYHFFSLPTCSDCGCGSGDSGCSRCGCCKVCAGISDSWGGGNTFHELEDVDQVAYERIIRARAGGVKKEKKEEKGGAMGLQLLFGG